MNFNIPSIERAINYIAEVTVQAYDIKEVEKLLVDQKKEVLQKDNQELAAHIWCLQQAVDVHRSYLEAFSLLKKGAFYDAWCELEKAEKGVWSIKSPQSYLPDHWEELWTCGQFNFIEEHVSKWRICSLIPMTHYQFFCAAPPQEGKWVE